MERLPVYSIRAFEQAQSHSNFYVNALSAHLLKHHFVQSPHKHDFYMCVLITKGSGDHEIDFITYKVKPGAVFLLSPGQMHNWKLSKDVEGLIFFHTREFYEINFLNRKIHDFPFYSSVFNSPLIQLKGASLETTSSLMHEMLQEKKGNGPMKNEKLCSLVDLVYIELSRQYIPKNEVNESNRRYMLKLCELVSLIDKHFREIKSPSEYAGMMNMSLKHLNRICKTSVGKTLSDMITERIILEAKRMLVQPEYTVAQIADELGIFDHSYFSRLFKKNTGETPVQFAERYRK